MKLRIAAVIGLLVVGVGAVYFSLGGPGLFATSANTTYLTTTAAVANVVKDVVATGKVAAASTYGLRFGQVPLATTASGAGGGGGQNAAGNTQWPVTAVKVTVGQAVKKGDLLASADPTYANASVAVAQANVDAAQTKLASDINGADDATKATLQDAINLAKQNLSNSKQSQTITASQNALTLQSAIDAVTAAQVKLDTDSGNGALEAVIAKDQTDLASVTNKLASTRLQVLQSNQNATQQVANSELSVTSAQNNYTLKTAPASAATISQDQASLLTAQTALANAQTSVKYANLVAPEDGVIVTVNLTAGVAAPTGDAITFQSSALQAVASVTESDVSTLTLGMAATVTATSSSTAMTGKLLTISPVSAGGGGQAVVTYQIVVSLDSVPAGILSGMTAQVSIRLGQVTNVVAIPSTALNGTKGAYTVKVMDAAGQVTSKPVTVGLLTTSLAEIQAGITAGEVVVTGLANQRTTTTTNTNAGTNILGGGGQAIPGGAGQGLGR